MTEEERDIKSRKNEEEQGHNEEHVALAPAGLAVCKHGVHAHPEGHEVEP